MSTSLGRIGKLFGAQNANQLLTVMTQLSLPPAFLYAYGVSLYGQWLALGAAITYLSTFNYGLQTYANMQMTIHYNRGELQQTREVQSAGLRILLSTFLLFNAALLVVFLIPLDTLLQLSIPLREAQWTLYILGCQIVTGMVFGFFNNSYMVVGMAHRGANFANLNQLLILILQVALVLSGAAFHWIALSQLACTLASTTFLIADFGRLAPDLRPTLRYWKKGSLGQMLRPSAQYALLYSSNVVAYQLPTLLMQRVLGPSAVVVYSVTRTIYSMSRRVLNVLTNSIGPEITLAVGQRDWIRLQKLYEFSERLILLMIPPITFGTMLATPLLLQVWLHKGNLYDPGVCILLGISVSLLGIKEHKYQFQFSSNEVRSVSYLSLFAYGAQLLLAAPVMLLWGLPGYLALWCANELYQLFFMLKLNERLFAGNAAVDRVPVYRLLILLTVSSALLAWPMYHITELNLIAQGLIAAATALLMGALSYRLFNVDEVRSLLWSKLRGLRR